MLDTGAEVNIIKISALRNKKPINYGNIMKLSGITPTNVKTLGQILINIYGTPSKFQVVDDTFPIPYSGIIGAEFFVKEKADINFETNLFSFGKNQIEFQTLRYHNIPPNCTESLKIPLPNGLKDIGYTPGIFFGKGINGGGNLTRRYGKTAYIRVTNSTNKEIEIPIPVVELDEGYKTPSEYSKKINYCNVNPAQTKEQKGIKDSTVYKITRVQRQYMGWKASGL